MAAASWKRTASAATGAVRAIVRRGVDLVLPPRCVMCQSDLSEAQTVHEAFCAACFADLLPHELPPCRKCGMPVPTGTQGQCPHCRGRRYPFHRVFRAGIYEGPLREAVLRSKHVTGEPVAAALGRWLAAAVTADLADWPEPSAFDLATCVPSYWLRRLARGTNSAAVIAQAAARVLQIPPAFDLLVCRKNIEKQSTLAISERRRNVRGAFRKSWGYDINGACVLLVDDVMTTGATSHEISRVLRRAGAAKVAVAVVARALGPDW